MPKNNIEFRHMLRGEQKAALNIHDLQQIKAFQQIGSNKHKALLMLHGFTSSPAVFRFLIPEITQYDAIVCPVLPGHTGYLKELATVTAQDWITAAENACETLLNEYQQVDVLGLSLGGLLACHLNKKYPLNHLYLLAPALDLYIPINLVLKLLTVLKTMGFSQFYANAGNILASNTEITYRRIPLTTIKEVLTLIKTFEWIPPQNPVDLFLGSQDTVVNSQKIAQRFSQCTQVKLHWLSNSAHVLPLDNDKNIIIDNINLHS